MGKLWK